MKKILTVCRVVFFIFTIKKTLTVFTLNVNIVKQENLKKHHMNECVHFKATTIFLLVLLIIFLVNFLKNKHLTHGRETRDVQEAKNSDEKPNAS